MKSMTGYGSAVLDNDAYQVSVEIKTLNSKFFDALLKTPKSFSEKEIEIRNLLSERLDRGKISLTLEFQKKNAARPKININKELFRLYYQELHSLAVSVNASRDELFKLTLQSPDVIVPDIDNEDIEQDFEVARSVLLKAIDECNQFRLNEGEQLKRKILEYIGRIDELMQEIPAYEDERLEAVKNKLKASLTELLNDNEYDKDRFEQELIYYIEKLDISEEKVRLSSHIDYFRRTMDEQGPVGKKLGFITQEIGREINTIGSKASHAGIQRIVIQMKEELEKIKEQILNVI